MDLTHLVIFILSALWITYRIFFVNKFLLWDWRDGTTKYFWDTPEWRKHEDEYFGRNQ